MKAVAALSLVFALAGLSAAPARAQTGAFDGAWNVAAACANASGGADA